MKIFIDYIKELQETPIDQITEHSKRASLENLLKCIASELPDKIKILHEPKFSTPYSLYRLSGVFN